MSTCLKSQVSGALCLRQSCQCKQELPLEVLVLLPLNPLHHDLPPALLPMLSECLSTFVLLEAISSKCPGALPLAAIGDHSVLYGTNFSAE